MKILFLGLTTIDSLTKHDMYTDLLRALSNKGHTIFCVTSTERRKHKNTSCLYESKNGILQVKTLNIQKTNIFEKGLGTLLITNQFKKAIKKYFKGIKFDLILYPTPPITLYGVVKYFKKKDGAKAYLMLKDIFPQNAVDLGLIKTTGINGLIYKYFRKQEKRLYSISDRIGCMSDANVDYVLKHNPELAKDKIEVFPNCIEVCEHSLTDSEKRQIREKYHLPLDKNIFVYGGNLGKPQGIHFIIDCLKSKKADDRVFFLIVGDGTEFKILEEYFLNSKQSNFLLMNRLPADEFDRMIASCDVGLVFLDYRFTIPNFPSRMLSYMQAHLPILACTDTVTDVGKMLEENDCGWWCESNDSQLFSNAIDKILSSSYADKGQNSFNCLLKSYSTDEVSKKVDFFINQKS